MAGPLAGVRLVEIGNFMAAPFAAVTLADLGADVIKVEHPDGGDYSRAKGPFAGGEAMGFMQLNRGKRSVALNLKHPIGRDLFLELVANADALIENMKPGTMADLGLDYEQVRRVNPAIIFCSVSGWGQTGPWRGRAGLDLVVQGVSGIMNITGDPASPPVKAGVPITDLTTAMYAATSILAAYVDRLKTGQGQYIDLSLFECALSLQVWETSGYFGTGAIPQRLGSAHRNAAPYQAIQCRDGYITVGATNASLWQRFCRALGLDDLLQNPRFKDNPARKQHERELIARIEEVTRQEPGEAIVAKLEAVGVPAGKLYNLAQALGSDQVEARRGVVAVEHPSAGPVRQLASPIHLGRDGRDPPRPAPRLGEHTEAVLRDLGYDAASLAAFRDEGVIGPA